MWLADDEKSWKSARATFCQLTSGHECILWGGGIGVHYNYPWIILITLPKIMQTTTFYTTGTYKCVMNHVLETIWRGKLHPFMLAIPPPYGEIFFPWIHRIHRNHVLGLKKADLRLQAEKITCLILWSSLAQPAAVSLGRIHTKLASDVWHLSTLHGPTVCLGQVCSSSSSSGPMLSTWWNYNSDFLTQLPYL